MMHKRNTLTGLVKFRVVLSLLLLMRYLCTVTAAETTSFLVVIQDLVGILMIQMMKEQCYTTIGRAENIYNGAGIPAAIPLVDALRLANRRITLFLHHLNHRYIN